MRRLSAAIAFMCIAIVLAAAGTNFGGEKDKVTLKGKITCAKCDLGQEKKCMTVIVVTEDKKDVVYFFDAAGHKTNHGKVCQTPKNGTVEGVVGKDGDKKTITVSKVTFE